MESKVSCKNCGVLVCPDGKGLCIRCVKLKKFSKRTCKHCGDKIGWTSKHGVCVNCRENKTENKQKKKEGQMITCHMPGCGRVFKKESWMHSVIAYCRECRKSEVYQNYHGYQRSIREGAWVK